MPKLMIDEGGQASVFELFDEEVTIGRGANNSIQVADGRVSKHHAVIRTIGGRAKLVDLESKNGTRVNGDFRNQHWLGHGDRIALGAATLTFDAADAPAAPTPWAAAAAVPRAAAVAAPAAWAEPAEAPAAPAPVVRSSTRHGRSGARGRRDDDGDYDDEGDRRVPARRGSNSGLVALGVGGAVLGVIALLFVMLSHSGAGANAQALVTAKSLYAKGKVQQAYDYLLRHGDPSDEDGYISVAEELARFKKELSSKGSVALEDEALAEWKKIEFDWVEKWKNKQTNEQWVARLKDFAIKYRGTLVVTNLLGSPYDKPPKMRELMGEQKAWEALKSLREDWESRKAKGLSDTDVALRIRKFEADFAGTLELQEMQTSQNDPYPEFRRLIGAK